MESATIQETCQAEGYPPPKLTWIRLVSPLPAGKTEVKKGNLTIRNLQPVDSGLYQCVATNSLGAKKATMNLFVQSIPGGLYIAHYARLIYHDHISKKKNKNILLKDQHFTVFRQTN